MGNKSKVKIKESTTKKVDPAIVAKELGAAEVSEIKKIKTKNEPSKKKKDNIPKFDPKFFYADGWPRMPEFLVRRKKAT